MVLDGFGFSSYFLLVSSFLRACLSDDGEAAFSPSKGFSLRSVCIHVFVVLILGIISYGFYWFMQKENRRQQEFKLFMQTARSQLGGSSGAYTVAGTKYLKIRKELFDEHNNDKHPSIEAADAATAAAADEDSFSISWQRNLPDAAKKKLKAALVWRVIALIPRWSEVEREFKDMKILFNKRLIADVHWHSVKSEHENICSDLVDIIREANCLEDDWGDLPNGLFATAHTIMRHEAVKERLEREEKEKEKETQRLEKLKRAAEKEEQEKQERQERKAAEVLRSLLEEDDEIGKKKKSKA